MRVYRALEMFF